MDNQENTYDLPEKGMWLVFPRREKLEGEELSPFDILERKFQEEQHSSTFDLWFPPKSENRGVIGFITDDVENMQDIYLQGRYIRHKMSDEASQLDIYYKPCTTIIGGQQISIYRFSRNGVIFKRNPENSHMWKSLVWPREELFDPEEMEDHRGQWLIDLSPETGGQDEKSSRARALMKLLDATRRDVVKLYSSSTDCDRLVCWTGDDREPLDVYLQGMVIRKILGDQAKDATMYYNTNEMIRAVDTSVEGFKGISEYLLSNTDEFYRKKKFEVGKLWIKIDTSVFEYPPQDFQVTP